MKVEETGENSFIRGFAMANVFGPLDEMIDDGLLVDTEWMNTLAELIRGRIMYMLADQPHHIFIIKVIQKIERVSLTELDLAGAMFGAWLDEPGREGYRMRNRAAVDALAELTTAMNPEHWKFGRGYALAMALKAVIPADDLNCDFAFEAAEALAALR